MTSVARMALAGFGLSLVLGCGGGAPAPATTDAEDEQAAKELGRDTDKTVFDDMVQTEDRARGVEDLTLGRKQELDRALDEATGDATNDDE